MELNHLCLHAREEDLRALPRFEAVIKEYEGDLRDPERDAARLLYAAYGYVDMGGWIGGQAEYVMCPYADFNLLKFPDKAKAMAKIKDLTLLSDIFPTGYHGAVTAGVGPGTTVYVAGAGPVGLACAIEARREQLRARVIEKDTPLHGPPASRLASGPRGSVKS